MKKFLLVTTLVLVGATAFAGQGKGNKNIQGQGNQTMMSNCTAGTGQQCNMNNQRMNNGNQMMNNNITPLLMVAKPDWSKVEAEVKANQSKVTATSLEKLKAGQPIGTGYGKMNKKNKNNNKKNGRERRIENLSDKDEAIIKKNDKLITQKAKEVNAAALTTNPDMTKVNSLLTEIEALRVQNSMIMLKAKHLEFFPSN